MCGICVSVLFLPKIDNQTLNNYLEQEHKHLKELLKRRGPNSFSEVTCDFKEKFCLHFCSSVLHLRGSDIIVQPLVSEGKYTDENCQDVFLWNGEIFGGPLFKACPDSVCDTTVLAEKLFSAETSDDVLQILTSIEGPYAFVFYQSNGLLWFGRDIFGRRSLLWNFSDSRFHLCSLAANRLELKWEEVPTTGIFCLNLNLKEQPFVIHQYASSLSASGRVFKKDADYFVPESNPVLDENEDSPVAEIKVLESILDIPLSESLNKSLPSDASIPNVLSQMTDLQALKLNVPELLQKLLEISALQEAVNNFEVILADAVKKRVEQLLSLCKNCYYDMVKSSSIPSCKHSYIGVLFSGGLDSIVIACLADRFVDSRSSIDLLNVAFAKEHLKNTENTPDRITGKAGFQTLKSISPSRKWNFVEVNVVDSELHAKRAQHISDLLYPSCTVLDDSIGCALWFASRGEGCMYGSNDLFHTSPVQVSYKSPARVLLVGIGADEQLGGYSRHRAKFKNAGWPGVIEEIALEIDRIGSRNLGRDDRIIADNSVESRYPFLDEHVVSYLNSLHICLKVNLNFERGIGEKLLLRLLAFKLGLTEAAVLPKRAIQFGSRIANLQDFKQKGSDVCSRLQL